MTFENGILSRSETAKELQISQSQLLFEYFKGIRVKERRKKRERRVEEGRKRNKRRTKGQSKVLRKTLKDDRWVRSDPKDRRVRTKEESRKSTSVRGSGDPTRPPERRYTFAKTNQARFGMPFCSARSSPPICWMNSRRTSTLLFPRVPSVLLWRSLLASSMFLVSSMHYACSHLIFWLRRVGAIQP